MMSLYPNNAGLVPQNIPGMPMMNSSMMNIPGASGFYGPGGMSSAAQFHQPTEKHQVKLFVGGLAFPTTETDLTQYFQDFGKVENTIVMRDKQTGRGRGFGFVLMSFKDEEDASKAKQNVLTIN